MDVQPQNTVERSDLRFATEKEVREFMLAAASFKTGKFCAEAVSL